MASQVTGSRRPPAAEQPELQPWARWTPYQTAILADLMVQQVHRGNKKRGGSFTKLAWKSICNDFFNHTGFRCEMVRLKSRYSHLKRQHAVVKSLLDQSEFSWDESTGAVIASDEAWKTFISEHPDAEAIRTSGCPLYKQLCTIFSEPEANGKHAFSTDIGPNGLPSIPKPEPLYTVPVFFRSESEEPDAAAAPAAVDAEDDYAFQPSMSGRKRGRKGIDDAIAAAILEMAEASKLRAAAAKQVDDRYSIASCIKELDEMQGLDQCLYFAALDLFDNPNARETFLCLKVGKRLTWLVRKCASSPDHLS